MAPTCGAQNVGVECVTLYTKKRSHYAPSCILLIEATKDIVEEQSCTPLKSIERETNCRRYSELATLKNFKKRLKDAKRRYMSGTRRICHQTKSDGSSKSDVTSIVVSLQGFFHGTNKVWHEKASRMKCLVQG